MHHPHAASAASAASTHLPVHPPRPRGAVVHSDALVASFEQELALRRAVAAELRYGAVDEQRAAPLVIPHLCLCNMQGLITTAVDSMRDSTRLRPLLITREERPCASAGHILLRSRQTGTILPGRLTT